MYPTSLICFQLCYNAILSVLLIMKLSDNECSAYGIRYSQVFVWSEIIKNDRFLPRTLSPFVNLEQFWKMIYMLGSLSSTLELDFSHETQLEIFFFVAQAVDKLFKIGGDLTAQVVVMRYSSKGPQQKGVRLSQEVRGLKLLISMADAAPVGAQIWCRMTDWRYEIEFGVRYWFSLSIGLILNFANYANFVVSAISWLLNVWKLPAFPDGSWSKGHGKGNRRLSRGIKPFFKTRESEIRINKGSKFGGRACLCVSRAHATLDQSSMYHIEEQQSTYSLLGSSINGQNWEAWVRTEQSSEVDDAFLNID
ncbi:hypothetical protein VNO77_12294 [Canavalia gladiata]|uniref:Uncharacterized protein n=1 Tax=Canavalia gladiata TaxID=3824 RepID=A0AAN9M1E6_CANGL